MPGSTVLVPLRIGQGSYQQNMKLRVLRRAAERKRFSKLVVGSVIEAAKESLELVHVGEGTPNHDCRHARLRERCPILCYLG